MNPASAEMLIRASIHCMPIKMRERASFLNSCSLGGVGPDPSKVSRLSPCKQTRYGPQPIGGAAFGYSAHTRAIARSLVDTPKPSGLPFPIRSFIV